MTIATSDSLSGVLKSEYFLGSSDHGQGNATTMNFDGSNVSASFSNMAAGIYAVNFRVQDKAGNWSPTETDYLVVYNPQIGGISGHINTVSSIFGADVLSGLIQSGQTDPASFALSVKYDSNGNIVSSSKLKLSYSTGTN